MASAVGERTAGSFAGKTVKKLTCEKELVYELDGEYELEDECNRNFEAEAMVVDILADAASKVANEAEAYAGAATAIVLKPKSASMQKVTPSVIKGAARLTKTLRKSSTTHPLVKMVPIITRLTNETQKKSSSNKALNIFIRVYQKALEKFGSLLV